MRLLEIQSSPRGESSDSITLTKSFIEACRSDRRPDRDARRGLPDESFLYRECGRSFMRGRLSGRDLMLAYRD